MESWWVMVAIGNIIYMIGACCGSTPSTGRYTSVVIHEGIAKPLIMNNKDYDQTDM
jgi:hypothetical protein